MKISISTIPSTALLCLSLLAPLAAQARDFKMGFTDFPFAPTQAAVDETWAKILPLSDIITFQMDDGVAWTESLWNLPFAPDYQSSLQARLAKVPAGVQKFVAANPLAFDRKSLALARGAQPNQPLDAFWSSQPLNSPYVKYAYLNYCLRLISFLKPDYFAIGIEGNVLFEKDPGRWGSYIELIYSTYAGIKAKYPSLPLTVTIQAESLHANFSGRAIAAQQLALFSDFISISTYPYYLYNDPSQVPADYLDRVIALGGGKPFAIAETGWPAETIGAPFPKVIPSSTSTQGAYVKGLLDFLKRKGTRARFVNYFLVKDYDQWWRSEMQYNPDAALLRLWKDIGMFDQDTNTPRIAYLYWYFYKVGFF